MRVWRLLDTGSNNGFYNMAVDEAIAIASKEGIVKTTTLRFYRWSPPCMSIGYFQKMDEVALTFMVGSKWGMNPNATAWQNRGSSDEDIAVVRRITGGRAEFHGND